MSTESGRAPVQAEWHRDQNVRRPSGTISWAEHLEVYAVYSRKYGASQSAERIAERGGFGYNEIILFTGQPPKTWKPREQYLWPVAKPVTRNPICPKCGIDERTVTVASACNCDEELATGVDTVDGKDIE